MISAIRQKTKVTAKKMPILRSCSCYRVSAGVFSAADVLNSLTAKLHNRRSVDDLPGYALKYVVEFDFEVSTPPAKLLKAMKLQPLQARHARWGYSSDQCSYPVILQSRSSSLFPPIYCVAPCTPNPLHSTAKDRIMQS